ncbi:DUF523 domain-containing protein [Thalassotalea sediminis]|uniref:DUF523 domain-containing protein n=1 Tax=Thalassotalea sediminis TaxID=1759089 RepID=UPI002572AFF5|nr:DUF523 domain-containing protein [Thalassotalea sediminis]
MEKILVSACLMGELVRYDGGHQKLINEVIERWRHQGRIIQVCPEVAGGLSIPRLPAERVNGLIIDTSGKNVTDAFVKGANQTLDICKKHGIKYALLKESSPSCGSNTIYDGSFNGTKIPGQGVTAALLQQHGIEVFSEQTLMALIAKVESMSD